MNFQYKIVWINSFGSKYSLRCCKMQYFLLIFWVKLHTKYSVKKLVFNIVEIPQKYSQTQKMHRFEKSSNFNSSFQEEASLKASKGSKNDHLIHNRTAELYIFFYFFFYPAAPFPAHLQQIVRFFPVLPCRQLYLHFVDHVGNQSGVTKIISGHKN